jgi:hypothetical protein
MLGNLENEPGVVVLDLESIQNGRQGSRLKLNINNGTNDGADGAGGASSSRGESSEANCLLFAT